MQFFYSKIRNPFIDHPEWVNMIWSETPDAVTPQAPSNLSISQLGKNFLPFRGRQVQIQMY